MTSSLKRSRCPPNAGPPPPLGRWRPGRGTPQNPRFHDGTAGAARRASPSRPSMIGCRISEMIFSNSSAEGMRRTLSALFPFRIIFGSNGFFAITVSATAKAKIARSEGAELIDRRRALFLPFHPPTPAPPRCRCRRRYAGHERGHGAGKLFAELLRSVRLRRRCVEGAMFGPHRRIFFEQRSQRPIRGSAGSTFFRSNPASRAIFHPRLSDPPFRARR